jgi:hypothetical protein
VSRSRRCPSIAFAAHRAGHLERSDELSVIVTGILAAAIGMEDQARRGMAPKPGHAQRIHYQRPCHALAHRKADHLPVEQVDHHGKVKPALFGPEIGVLPVHTLFGASTVKLRASRFGATGRSCALFVVALNRRLPRARRPQAFSILRTRSLPARMPRVASSRYILGQP